jgi:DNA-binding IclR family transcriptional regulator
VPRPSPSTSRVIELLNFLGDHPRQFFSLSELARQLDLNKATAHGMLGVLSDAGYLFRHPVDKTFSLGPAIVALGQAAVAAESKVVAFAHTEMEALSEATGAQCVASTAIGDEVVIVAVVGLAFVPTASDLGYRARLYPPHGLVFLAWASDTRVESWLDSVAATPIDRKHYREMLVSIRDRGFSLAANAQARSRLDRVMKEVQDEALTPEVHKTLAALGAELAQEERELFKLSPNQRYQIRSISAPVFDAFGNVCLALILRGFPELTGRQIVHHAESLVAACASVSRLIGGTTPDRAEPAAPARTRSRARATVR